LYWAWRYRPATNRNIRTCLVCVSIRIDLSIKETLLVNKRRWVQMQRKTVMNMDELVTWVSHKRVAEGSSLVQCDAML
jgi:hypothetical protein